MDIFWQTWEPSRLVFQLGKISVHWYGLILVFAMLAGFFYVRPYFIKRSLLSRAQVDDLFFYVIMGGLLGARLGHVLFFNFIYYWAHPLDILKIWQGGLSIQGAVLFSALTLWWWCRKNRVSFWQITDHLVPGVALGQAIGRWGNYFNQELYGRPTDSVIGIYISPDNRIVGFEKNEIFQPTFLYESLASLLLFIILIKLLKIGGKSKGFLSLVYLGGYSLIRFLMEFIRIDPTPLIFGLRLPQLISVLVIIIVLCVLKKYYLKPLPKPRI
ncbi:MAG: prolipoprotein diacylglyceryl transferase [Parcubacteria group bacterium]|nr:MAG: prolipoprotein diacylglyceryl transferase [Parcubacteria group bacterium]